MTGSTGGLGRGFGAEGSLLFSDLIGNTGKHRETQVVVVALRRWGGEGTKVDGWQHVDVNTYPPILSFSGGLGRV